MAIGDQHSALVPSRDGLSIEDRGAEPMRHRADLLLNCAQMLHCHLDVGAVISSLASRIQELLPVETVLVMLRRGERFVLEAVASSNAEVASAIHAGQVAGKFRF